MTEYTICWKCMLRFKDFITLENGGRVNCLAHHCLNTPRCYDVELPKVNILDYAQKVK